MGIKISNRYRGFVADVAQVLLPIYEAEEARSIAKRVLSDIVGVTTTEMALYPDREISLEFMERIEIAIERLSKGEPLQYVAGFEEFCGERFEVGEGVLIPRPETEELVEIILKQTKIQGDDKIKIVDLACGSGCIGISLANRLTNSQLVSVDLSEKALEYTQRNAEKILGGKDVKVIKMDLLDENRDESEITGADIIVSNPPYIMEMEKQQMRPNVLNFEPHLALFVSDDDPLLFYRAIAKSSKERLNKGGRLYFEINEALGKEMVELMEMLGYQKVILYKDFRGKDRFVQGEK